jgi:hypothetical protein
VERGVRRHPELAELISADQPLPQTKRLRSVAAFHLGRRLQDPSPLIYVVEGLFPLPSLSIVYGAPGTIKSLLMADLAICAAAGLPWLPPLPHLLGVRRPPIRRGPVGRLR